MVSLFSLAPFPFPMRASQRNLGFYYQVADAIHRQIADLSSIVAELTHDLQTTLQAASVDGRLSLRREERKEDTLPSGHFEPKPGGASSSSSCTEAVADLQ